MRAGIKQRRESRSKTMARAQLTMKELKIAREYWGSTAAEIAERHDVPHDKVISWIAIAREKRLL